MCIRDSIYSNRLNFGRVRTEENALWSFAPHDVAVILRIIGELPKSVTCTGGSYITPHLADATVATLHFAAGQRAPQAPRKKLGLRVRI